MDRSADDRSAGWRGESNRNAWNRDREESQSGGNWRSQSNSDADRGQPAQPGPAYPNAFRGGWGNTGGYSESFYNRGMSPYEPGVGGLEALESHTWRASPPRAWGAPSNADWPNAPRNASAGPIADTDRDWGRDERSPSRQPGWWGHSPPPTAWSSQHAGIAEPTWGGGGYSSRRDRDWSEPGNSWSRGAGGRDLASDWARPTEGPHRGRGPQGYQRSDSRIHEDICDTLTERGDIDASAIQVRVHDREVTLEGTVADRRMKRVAEDVAESARGVRDVHNRLRVESEWAEHRTSRAEHRDPTRESGREDTRESERAGNRPSRSRSASRSSRRKTGAGRTAAGRTAAGRTAAGRTSVSRTSLSRTDSTEAGGKRASTSRTAGRTTVSRSAAGGRSAGTGRSGREESSSRGAGSRGARNAPGAGSRGRNASPGRSGSTASGRRDREPSTGRGDRNR